MDTDVAFWEGFLGEFFKLSQLNPEDLERSIKRVEELEKGVDHQQLKRYAAVGAVATPIVSALEKIVSGEPILHKDSKNKILIGKTLRTQAGKSVAGALGAGVLPIIRHQLDRKVEKERLSEMIRDFKEKNPSVDMAVKKATALIPQGTTPKRRLLSSRRVGMSDGSANITDPTGPSISQISKPKGYGRPLPGTTKPSSGL